MQSWTVRPLLRVSCTASCRLSFYLYNTSAEADRAVAAVAAIATGHHQPTIPWYRRLTQPARYGPARSPIRV